MSDVRAVLASDDWDPASKVFRIFIDGRLEAVFTGEHAVAQLYTQYELELAELEDANMKLNRENEELTYERDEARLLVTELFHERSIDSRAYPWLTMEDGPDAEMS